jgi:Spx/MgsR family transcriptional regulator
MTTLYGIHNCNTVKQARRWLDAHGVDYRFHDVRKDGLDQAMLQVWEQQLGWDALLNRRGTTWRKLPDTLRERIDRCSALDVMLEQPSIIKRPLLEHGRNFHLGFSAEHYRTLFE